MNEHKAHEFVKNSIINLTGISLASHLWGWYTLSDVGLGPELIEKLSLTLGLDPTTIKPTLTLHELTYKVAKESSVEM